MIYIFFGLINLIPPAEGTIPECDRGKSGVRENQPITLNAAPPLHLYSERHSGFN